VIYFIPPKTSSDLRLVLRCLWALDPNRHLFEGDFRDFAHELIAKIFSAFPPLGVVPEEALDEIKNELSSGTCSPTTRRCWEGITGAMRRDLEKIHIFALWSPEFELWRFIRHSFRYGSGRYWNAKELPQEFKRNSNLADSEFLKAVVSTLRQHLDPNSVECALILWILWCLETLWPEQAGNPALDYRPPRSLSRQLLDEIEGPVPRTGIPALIAAGADPAIAEQILRRKFDRESLAHAIAKSGRTEALRLLRFLPIDDKNHDGETPLLVALWRKRWKAARWFLDTGANPGIKSSVGEPALTAALKNGAPHSLVLRFLEKGADPRALDAMGDTALHAAAAAGRTASIGALSAVQVECGNKLGHTPLYSAVFAMVAGKGNRIATIKTLQAAGANPDPVSKKGVRVSDFLKRALALGGEPGTIRKIQSTLGFP